MHEKSLKHKTDKEYETKGNEMEDKSNQNAATHKINLESIDTKCKKFYQEIKKPDSSTKRLGKLELKLELNLLCHIWLQFQRLIPQTSSDARLRGKGGWHVGGGRGGWLATWRRRGLGVFGVQWVRGLGLATCRQTTFEFLANYFIYLLFRIAQIIITYTFIQISISVNFTD